MNLFQTLLKTTPFVTRIIILILLITTLINQYLPHASDILLLSVPPIIQKYQIWRIFTGFTYEPKLLVVITLLWNMHSLLAKYEFKNSSPVLLVDFFINGILISVMYTPIALAYYLFIDDKEIFTFGALGLWSNFLVKYAYNNRDHNEKLFSLIPIPLTFYPAVFYVLCCIFSGSVRYDGLYAMILAVVQCHFYKSGIIAFTLDTYTDKEAFAEKICLNQLECWKNVNPKKIIEGQYLTVYSQQFFENLYEFDPLNPPQEPMDEDGGQSHRSMNRMTEQIEEQEEGKEEGKDQQ